MPRLESIPCSLFICFILGSPTSCATLSDPFGFSFRHELLLLEQRLSRSSVCPGGASFTGKVLLQTAQAFPLTHILFYSLENENAVSLEDIRCVRLKHSSILDSHAGNPRHLRRARADPSLETRNLFSFKIALTASEVSDRFLLSNPFT